MKRKSIIFALLLLLNCLLLSACEEDAPVEQPEQSAEAEAAESPDPAEDNCIQFSVRSREPWVTGGYADYPTSGNSQVLRDHADSIVIGHYDEFIKAWNIARDLEDSSKESSEHYVEGHIYSFQVEQVVKGECSEETIYINIPYKERIRGEITNVVINDRGSIVKEATERDLYEFEVIRQFYIEPKLGERVMLFLRGDPEFDSYFAAIEPYMIAFDENDIAEVRSNFLLSEEEKLKHAQQFFKTESGRDVIYRHSNLLRDKFTDNISGKSLQQLLEEMDLD